jgi:hypothetical protein
VPFYTHAGAHRRQGPRRANSRRDVDVGRPLCDRGRKGRLGEARSASDAGAAVRLFMLLIAAQASCRSACGGGAQQRTLTTGVETLRRLQMPVEASPSSADIDDEGRGFWSPGAEVAHRFHRRGRHAAIDDTGRFVAFDGVVLDREVGHQAGPPRSKEVRALSFIEGDARLFLADARGSRSMRLRHPGDCSAVKRTVGCWALRSMAA